LASVAVALKLYLPGPVLATPEIVPNRSSVRPNGSELDEKV